MQDTANDEIVLESLDILVAIDRAFPPFSRDAGGDNGDGDGGSDGGGGAAEEASRRLESAFARDVVASADAFDTDCDEWLHNTDARREPRLRAAALAKLAWLEEALGEHEDGAFFLGAWRPPLPLSRVPRPPDLAIIL